MATTWDNLKQYDLSTVTVKFERDTDVEKEYGKLTKQAREELLLTIKKQLEKEGIFLRKNDYPYKTENNIVHYVLWISNNQNTETSKKYIASCFNKK